MIEELRSTLPQVGRLDWIGLSPASRAPIETVDEVRVEVDTGLVGDRHARSGQARTAHRQVTLVQGEHLPVLAGLCGHEEVRPEDLRRNLVVTGLNLLALKERRFSVGEVHLEWTGPCEPCSRMEENLGPGGWNAMRGHGGITARVLRPGTIRVGDEVRALPLG